MIPFANDTVTLVHRNEAGWTAVVLTGCSYRRVRRRSVADGAATITEETVCRIPAGGVMPAPGDGIILGNVSVSVDSEIELVRLLEAHRPGAFRVQGVSDNARPGMPIPHYAATGA